MTTKTDAASIEALADPVREFVDNYEFLSDNGNAVPLTDDHRALIEDAIHSFLATEPREDRRAGADGLLNWQKTALCHPDGLVVRLAVFPFGTYKALKGSQGRFQVYLGEAQISGAMDTLEEALSWAQTDLCKRILALLPAHDAAPRQSEAEPEAWLYHDPSTYDRDVSLTKLPSCATNGWTETPLYPPAPDPSPSGGKPAVCEHGIRWPWACEDCDKAALDAQAVQSASDAEARRAAPEAVLSADDRARIAILRKKNEDAVYYGRSSEPGASIYEWAADKIEALAALQVSYEFSPPWVYRAERAEERAKLMAAALVDHNEALRSAYSAAQRDAIYMTDGKANYNLLADSLHKVLNTHHETTNWAREIVAEEWK